MIGGNSEICTKKLVLFGAGKIGRSFIGQLFSRGGFEVVFIDVNESIIDELNKKHSYNIIIKGETEETLKIESVRGVFSGNYEEVTEEVATSGMLATAVGQEGLNNAIQLIAAGLIKRYKSNPGIPLDIIIAENIRNGSGYFHEELKKHLPEWFPSKEYIGTVETSIGKMVPIMLKKDVEKDPLQVFAEPYNTLILDKSGFKNPIPDLKGLSPKDNIKAWVDRKLFIHNLGHAAAAYLGYLYNPEFIYIFEALSVPEIFGQVRDTMLQSAGLLLRRYPGDFNENMLTEHIDDLLNRFRNRALGDTIFRVGCDLFRKLGPDDRLAGSIRMALDQGQPYDKILIILICACKFRAAGEDGELYHRDAEFVNFFNGDHEKILSVVCGFNPSENREVFELAGRIALSLEQSNIHALLKKGTEPGW
jgi:mannitol-1-phosphate 5-dehydrogenase